MQSVFKVSKPRCNIRVNGKTFTFDEGEYHNQLHLYDKSDILTFRKWMQGNPAFVEVYGLTEEIIEAESEWDNLSDWDRKMISGLIK